MSMHKHFLEINQLLSMSVLKQKLLDLNSALVCCAIDLPYILCLDAPCSGTVRGDRFRSPSPRDRYAASAEVVAFPASLRGPRSSSVCTIRLFPQGGAFCLAIFLVSILC